MHINMAFENEQAMGNAGFVRANSWYSPQHWTDKMRRKDSTATGPDELPSAEELRASGLAHPAESSSTGSDPKRDLSTGGVPLAEFRTSGNPAIV